MSSPTCSTPASHGEVHPESLENHGVPLGLPFGSVDVLTFADRCRESKESNRNQKEANGNQMK